MKKTILVVLLSSLLFSINSMAQNWLTAGNALSANGTLGTTTNFSVVFKSNNSERGRLTNGGLWGFGTTAPNSKVHINSASGQIPLRVQVNASTKFLVYSNGGVSIGSSSTPPANGLYVAGNVGVGTLPSNRLDVAAGFDGDGIRVIGSSSGPKDAAFILSDNLGHIGYLGLASANDAFMQGVRSGDIILSNSNGNILIGSGLASMRPTMRVSLGDVNISGTTNITGDLTIGTTSPLGPYIAKMTQSFYGLDIENKFSLDNWEFNVREAASKGVLELYFDKNFRGVFNSTNGNYASISDERLKTNIKPMSTMLEKIKQLKPSTYQFKNAADKQEYNGFIAQEVMKIFPSLVMHNVNPERNLDVYTMDYSGFGVIAIKGIQELEPVMEEQKEEIAILTNRIDKLEAALQSLTANNGNVSNVNTNASLEQNKPNPFNKNTIICYNIPQGSKGLINIFDQAGKLVKALNANAGGKSQINGHELAAGAYTYTLMVDGKVASSKQMLIIK